jgi:hypothetical protein
MKSVSPWLSLPELGSDISSTPASMVNGYVTTTRSFSKDNATSSTPDVMDRLVKLRYFFLE